MTLLRVYLTLSKAYLVNDNPRQALKYIEIYTRYVEDNPEAWTLTGVALYSIGKHEDAIESFGKALDLDDTLVLAYWYRGLSYLELDDTQNAVRDLVTAVRADPESFDINLAFSRALFAEDRFEDAIGQFNSAENLAQSDEERGQVIYYRAQAYQANNNLQAAQEDFESLLALPDGTVPVGWIEYAQEQLLVLNPPTDTVTPTPSPSLTATRTSASTSTNTPTRTPISTSRRTSTPTLTKLPSSTPRTTRTPSLTPSPTITTNP
jgi:tetratricopeptide (TPR) repeat protein